MQQQFTLPSDDSRDRADDLPAIPSTIPARDSDLDGRRQQIPTAGREWHVRESGDGGDTIVIEVGRLADDYDGGFRLSTRAFHLVCLYLAHRVRRKKAMTVRNDAAAIRRLCECAATVLGFGAAGPFDWSDYTEGVARGFLARGSTTNERGNDFSRLRRFYRWGASKGYRDFDLATLRILRRIRAPGNVKGAAVRHRDPLRGPFDERETKLLREAALDPRVADQDRAVLMLCLEWGSNPNQLVRLRNRDLKPYPHESNPLDFKIDIPRNKKRTAHRTTTLRPISRRLGLLLLSLRQGGLDDRLLHWLDPEKLKRSLGECLKRARRAARVTSPRTGNLLRVNPRRFRYTLGTEAAAQGASDEQVKDLLDHTDTQNVRVYTAFTPDHLKRVAAATDAELEALVGDFLGLIIADASAPVFPGVPRQLIPGAVPLLPDAPLDLGGVGLCGHDVEKEGLCALMQPVACYPCRKFAAFRHGPHRQVLAALESAQARLRTKAEPRIVMQLDQVVVALRQLIAQLDDEAGKPDVPVVQISRVRRQTYRTRGRRAS